MYEMKSILATGVVVFDSGQLYSWRRPVGPVAAR